MVYYDSLPDEKKGSFTNSIKMSELSALNVAIVCLEEYHGMLMKEIQQHLSK